MIFSLSAIGGPWGQRLDARREILRELDWGSLRDADPTLAERARVVWTRSAFSEWASAAAFAAIATELLHASAPIDLVAAAGEFIADEIVHAELAARLANALGGAVALEIDPARLVSSTGRRAPFAARGRAHRPHVLRGVPHHPRAQRGTQARR